MREQRERFALLAHRPDLELGEEERGSHDGRERVGLYFENPRTQMAMGIFPRELMIETLEERFRAHPNPPLD
ncbi:MAG: hypothetical protein AAB368_06380, partial [bacterium]